MGTDTGTDTVAVSRTATNPESEARHPGTSLGCAVVAPLLYLTVTIEAEAESARVHLHPGGQGFWIARMLEALGCGPRLVAPVGGEAGGVLEGLVPRWQIELTAVQVGAPSPVQVHDRRSGERIEIVGLEPITLDRHDADDLYGACLRAGLDCGALIVTSGGDSVLPDDAIRRLVHDVTAAGGRVFADIHGSALDALLEGGRVDLVKVSEDDLAADGRPMGSEQQAVDAARELAERGAGAVVVSRADAPAVATFDGRTVRVIPPPLEAVDHRGAGDSMTGAITAGRLLGFEPVDAVRLGAAAGAGNVTRRGLGSGDVELITELMAHVDIEDIP